MVTTTDTAYNNVGGSDRQPTTEPFPSMSPPSSPTTPGGNDSTDGKRIRTHSSTSTFEGRIRRASQIFEESSVPTGMWVATGQLASSIPTIQDVRAGSFSTDGWSGEGQLRERERRASQSGRRASVTVAPRRQTVGNRDRQDNLAQIPSQAEQPPSSVEPVIPEVSEGGPSGDGALREKKDNTGIDGLGQRSSSETNVSPGAAATISHDQYQTTPFENGYHFPPKHTWKQSTAIFLKAFWKFFITPLGFLVTIYGLNVVAWGGMLFLLLCNASPAMCHPTCNDINSPRRKWIEVDSQILNALFCVTGFGTIPWRFRDLYYLLKYRIQKKEIGLRRLAGINRGWFRLQGSQDLPITVGPDTIQAEISNVPENAIPYPMTKIPDAPLTGIRAPPTAVWKLDFIIWAMVWNTFLQAVLCGFMWHFDRQTRPSWSTGLFIALACIVAGLGGIMSFVEGKRVKGIEGVPVSEEDRERLERDRELGIIHYNNLNDEAPKEKKQKKNRGFFTKENKNEEDVRVEKTATRGTV